MLPAFSSCADCSRWRAPKVLKMYLRYHPVNHGNLPMNYIVYNLRNLQVTISTRYRGIPFKLHPYFFSSG